MLSIITMSSKTQLENGPRIMGSEMEYLIHDLNHAVTDLPERFYRYPAFNLKSIDYFLENGSRFYRDVHNGPEYASAECLGARGVVAAEIAGEKIVQASVESETPRRAASTEVPPPKPLRAFKQLIDTADNTRGHHENYLIRRHADLKKVIIPAITSHFMSRSIFCGAGSLRKDTKDGKPRFTLIEKGWGIESTDSSASTTKKPYVNLRDEPHAAEYTWRRLHVTGGDANIAPWAIWFTFASTSAVLRLIESGIDLSDLELESPLHAMRVFASDPSLKATARTIRGKNVTALNIQEALAERVDQNIVDKYDDPELKEYVAEADTACSDAKRDLALLKDRVDWVMKKGIVERKLDRLNLALDTQQGFDEAKRMDLYYASLSPISGIGIKLRERGELRPMVEEAEIQARIFTPPPDTRAAWRGGYIKDTPRDKIAKGNVKVNWSTISVGTGISSRTHTRNNPYSTK